MENTQRQLEQALVQVQAQQKVISSSQEFVKQVFSSHTTDMFPIGPGQSDKYVVVPPAGGNGMTFVYLLLRSSPIQGTLQLQFYIYSEPPGSYFVLAHNLVVDVWGDPPGNLQGKPFEVSYFPDTSDKDLITSLTVKDGRVFADGEPLPKLGQADPDFKGNKWMPMANPNPSPATK